MCGRFTLTKPVRVLAQLFDLPEPPAELAPRYNVAPSQVIAVVGRRADGTRRLALLRWGLVPNWTNDPRTGPRPVNARAESILSGMFREAFLSHRCLVPADGFFEWRTLGKKKYPHHFRFRDGRPFAFAGLFDVWGEGADRIATCCFITTDANPVVGAVHGRMPVILHRADYDAWLDPATPSDRLQGMLVPYEPAGEMEVVPVSQTVNSPRNDGPECLTPAAKANFGLFRAMP